MQILTRIPESQEHWLAMRAKDLTSTEVSALFNLNPYMTKFELWHRKKENITVDFQANERSLWGNRLEEAIAKASAEERGWLIRKAPEYVSAPDLRMGSSFDYIIQGSYKDDLADIEILEIKNVDSLVFKDGWLVDDDGEIEAPAHIELQIQQQMILKPEIQRTRIRALVGGNRMVEIVRERNPELAAAILLEVERFWKSIDENQPPDPNYAMDEDTLRKLYGYAEPGKVVDMSGDEQVESLVAEYNAAHVAFKLAEDRKTAAKSELFTVIGDAEKVLFSKGSISAGITSETFVEGFTRKSFRNFRVYNKKAK